MRFLGYCAALGFVATVLALGLWGTLGTLAVTNAQSEVQWIAASCEILSGNLVPTMNSNNIPLSYAMLLEYRIALPG